MNNGLIVWLYIEIYFGFVRLNIMVFILWFSTIVDKYKL